MEGWLQPVLPTIHLVIHPSSISLPSGGDVRREEEELKEGMQLATQLGTSGKTGLVGSRAHQSAQGRFENLKCLP